VNVRIPGENETAFAPKVPPKAPEQKAAVEEKKPEAKPEENRAAGVEFTVQVGVFNNPNGAIAKLSAAGVPHYTEAKGSLTRVFAGPFASREAAETALRQLKGLGLDQGRVTQKTG
jgi:DedD protein